LAIFLWVAEDFFQKFMDDSFDSGDLLGSMSLSLIQRHFEDITDITPNFLKLF